MSNKLRIAQLTWLRAPIQKSVDTTKLQLEVFNKKSKALACPPLDAQPVWFENQNKDRDAAFKNVEVEVKDIHAALDVAECIGGSALALEVKIIVTNISDNRLPQEKIEQALVSIMGSLLTIPKFLGMVVDGAPDSSGILAKQINELRELRGVPLLEEDNLLPPDVEFAYVEPPHRNRDATDDERQDVFGRSPKRFQTAFSAYMTNQNRAAVIELGDILRELQVVTSDLEVGCFWWVGECLTEALASGAIRAAGDTLSKIRMLSVAIQKAESDGEEGAKATLGVTRFKSLLSVLSMSAKLPQSIEDVLAVFNVRKSVDATSLAELQARIETASADSIKDVVVELKPLLETSMVSLGRAITSKSPQTFDAQIATFRTSIRQVASVFYMVNESEMAAVAAQSLARVEKVASVDGFTTEVIEKLKSDFMFLDEHIRRLDSNESIQSLRIPGVKPDVIASVVEQAIKELALTRRSITDHLDSGTGIEDLKSGLSRLVGASAALTFTGLTRAGLVLNGSCQGFLSQMTEQGIKGSRAIDMSARALVAVEGYLSAILAGMAPSPTLMTRAEEALGELNIQVEHVDVVSPSELMEKFEAAIATDVVDESDENHFLSEIFELRKIFEPVLLKPDVRDRKTMEQLYKAADRLAMGAKLYGFDAFHRLARALGTYSQTVNNHSRDEGFNRTEADALVVASLQMIFRCMDEYSARGKVSIFTRDMEKALLAKSDPGIVQAIDEHQITNQELNQPTDSPEPISVLVGELIEADTVPELREYPEGVDGGHIELYREEFVLYHSILLAFSEANRPHLSRDICRAAHSIHGISGSVNCKVLHEVYGVLESRFEVMFTAGKALTAEDTSVLSDLLVQTHKYMLDFPWVTETIRLGAWVAMAATIGEDIEEAQFTEMPAVIAKPSTEQKVALLDAHTEIDLNAEVQKIPHAESFPVETQRPSPAVEEDMVPVHTAEEKAPEYNEDFQFYLDEAEDVFPDLESNVAAWLEDMNDKDLVLTIKRNMHTLKGAALMAEAQSIAAITHSMESLFESLSIKLIKPSLECARLVMHVMQAMTAMTEDVKKGRAYPIPSVLIQCLEHSVNTNTIDLSLLHSDQAGPVARLAEHIQSSARPEFPIEYANEDKDQVDQPLDTAFVSNEMQAVSDPVEDSGAQSDNKPARKKRGGRGKGGKGQTPTVAFELDNDGEVVSTVHAGESHQDVLAQEINADVPELRTASYHPQAPELLSPSVNILADESIADPDFAKEPESQQQHTEDQNQVEPIEKIPHAESFQGDPVRAEYARQASEAFDRLYTIKMDREIGVDQPIVSNAVLDLLAREQAQASSEGKKTNGGTSEKIRVELHLLEAAAERASELVAVRYRLSALNEEAHIRLTGARELLEANSLQHGQLTTALRSFFNNQPQTRKFEDAAEADLERFNDLSAMHVAMGAQVDEVREQVHEIFSYIRQMRNALYELDPALIGLQRDLLHSRLVPFLNARQKLTGAAKTAAKATGKEVEATMEGEDVIMDKMMLDAISDPLTHILRNAIDHGIEAPAERLKLGKPEVGAVKIKASRRAKHIIIEISDDGRGIDVDVVQRKAIEMKIISDNDQLSRSEIMRLITHSGFSTAAKLTHVSGRGVGMDIVATTVEGLGGRLYIESEKGIGTRFLIELPFTIGSNKAMIVSSGSQWFAIQSYSMVQVLLVSRSSLAAQRAANRFATVTYDDRSFDVVHLADLVAMPDSRISDQKGGDVTVILCQQGDERIAIEVAEVDSMPEIHIRKLEGMLANVRGLVGETEMQDGSPVFVLDVMEMARLNLKQGSKGYQVRQNRVRSLKRENKPTVLVVDDSRSYRSQLERIFTGFGYTVITAVDGQNALHKLGTIDKPDLMLVDVEMPNMNGFEFTEAIRRRQEFDDTPIIMITTRTGLEEKAMRAGVTKYLLKPCDAASLQQAVALIKAQKSVEESAA
ncbi:histidine kinase [Pseudomonas veronii 1YdBTEX2]|uniref:Chemotaxis protein CheA n=1 Tax=Pseudomonas veronii 1YdBTEX2 TaxID=1295141 RepID=A0A1D3K7L1_PSEVE|nr:histidine kinase [Pseudomonas veronii 1YdBTEX2]